MSFIQQFFTSRDNNANAETFVGQEGRLWWDPVTNQIYSSDGSTPGGIPLAGGGGGNGTPGGTNGQVQFNQAGNFGGSANLTFNSTTGTLTAVSFVGNGSALTSITGSNVSGEVANATYSTTAGSATTAATVTTAAQPNITSVGTLTSLSSTGNISGNYFIGNGRTLTGIAGANVTGIVSLANIANYATLAGSALYANEANAVYGSNVVGQVAYAAVANSVSGSNVSGAVANATYATTASTVTTNAQPNITSVGNLTSVTVTGNTTSGNLLTNGLISATGNVTANYIIGNGSTLTNVSGANVSGTVANATYALSANSASSLVNGASIVLLNSDGTMAFPNNNINTGVNPITLWSTDSSSLLWRDAAGGTPSEPVQTIIEAGNGAATITVATGVLAVQSQKIWTFNTAGNIVFPDTTVQTTAFTGTATSANTAGTVTGNAQANITSVGTLTSLSVSGNVTAGNVRTGGQVSATGNITGGNVLSNGQLSTAGNITAGNISIGGNFSTPGNIGASYVNGAYYTGTWSTNFQAIGNVSATGNIISTGAVYSNYNTNTANTGSFMAQGGNTKGGTGYLDFLVVQNTSGGGTNPYKWFRVNPTGGLEIINSAYTATLLTLTDAGALSVASTVSSTGFNVNNKQAVNGPAFRAYIDSGQAITSGSQQKVTFNGETFDTNSNFASSRFTPTVEGYYQLNATVRISGGSGTGECMITIWKNGSEYARGHNESGTEQGASFYSMQVSDLAYANGTTDYFEIYIQQGSGSNKDTTAGTNISYFSGAMMRGA